MAKPVLLWDQAAPHSWGEDKVVLACEDAKRQWGSPAEPEIFSQIIICLFCMRIYCIYRPSCMWTQLSGEYIINFISLLIISILPIISFSNHKMDKYLFQFNINWEKPYKSRFALYEISSLHSYIYGGKIISFSDHKMGKYLFQFSSPILIHVLLFSWWLRFLWHISIPLFIYYLHTIQLIHWEERICTKEGTLTDSHREDKYIQKTD